MVSRETKTKDEIKGHKPTISFPKDSMIITT